MQNAKILIVDDDESHRMMLCAALKKEGFQTEEAPDGQDAVQLVRERFYDLILLDLKMKRRCRI